jgi:hypothetical protein
MVNMQNFHGGFDVPLFVFDVSRGFSYKILYKLRHLRVCDEFLQFDQMLRLSYWALLQVYLVLMATTVPVVQRQLELKASGR